MKKATRKQVEQVAEMWYARTQKLAAVYKNIHLNPDKRAKADRLISEMVTRLTKIGLLLMPKPPKNLKGESGIINIEPNFKPGSKLITKP